MLRFGHDILAKIPLSVWHVTRCARARGRKSRFDTEMEEDERKPVTVSQKYYETELCSHNNRSIYVSQIQTSWDHPRQFHS